MKKPVRNRDGVIGVTGTRPLAGGPSANWPARRVSLGRREIPQLSACDHDPDSSGNPRSADLFGMRDWRLSWQGGMPGGACDESR